MLLWERTDDCLDGQISASQNQSLFTMLLEGPQGSGKTAIAATLGLESEFPFVKVISSQNMMGYTESAKVALVTRTIEDAYRVRPLILLPLSPTPAPHLCNSEMLHLLLEYPQWLYAHVGHFDATRACDWC